ncbi:hypothetical protein EJB05_02348, partial [Eragrostis curvula]
DLEHPGGARLRAAGCRGYPPYLSHRRQGFLSHLRVRGRSRRSPPLDGEVCFLQQEHRRFAVPLPPLPPLLAPRFSSPFVAASLSSCYLRSLSGSASVLTRCIFFLLHRLKVPIFAREMTVLSDGGSSSSDPCSEGRSGTSHQRSELVEGDSSRTGELTAPVLRRAYNLRPRKDDPVTLQRRSEFSRSREQKPKKRKRKSMESKEYLQRAARRINKIINEIPEETHVDPQNRTEIINAGSAVLGMEKWRPYFSSPVTGLYKTTLKGACWTIEKLALQAAASVVGLKSITVANLVKKCQDTDEVADGLTINVYLQNHETCKGNLLYYDFYYNICVIQIESPVHLPAKGFCSQPINFDVCSSKDVVALGRDREKHVLVVSAGKIIPKCSMLDCEELFVSTCRISKPKVGGPLMNMDGDFVGMNYYHHKETPFIPSSIVFKCLQQFEFFRKVVKPWHGLRVRTLYADGCHEFEENQTKFLCGATCVIVEKIEKLSSAEASGLKEGDIIDQVNGVSCSNAAELGGILLDLATARLLGSKEICIKFHVMGCDDERTIVLDRPTPNGLNRWPFPEPIIVRKYVDGKLDSEEWYSMEP